MRHKMKNFQLLSIKPILVIELLRGYYSCIN